MQIARRYLFLRLFFCQITGIRMFMYKTSIAILYCAEYNFEKLTTHWREPKSPEEALCWKLKFGIVKCVHVLLASETYHWNKIDCQGQNTKNDKNAPVKLRKILFKIMNNSASAQTENEEIAKLRVGIRAVIIYLLKIKEDENYLNSTTIQHVHQHLKSLLKLKISQ